MEKTKSKKKNDLNKIFGVFGEDVDGNTNQDLKKMVEHLNKLFFRRRNRRWTLIFEKRKKKKFICYNRKVNYKQILNVYSVTNYSSVLLNKAQPFALVLHNCLTQFNKYMIVKVYSMYLGGVLKDFIMKKNQVKLYGLGTALRILISL